VTAEDVAMPEDGRYEAALTTALAIIHALTTRPGMSRPEQLSTVTFIILNTMHAVEEQPPERRLYPQPSIN
jgi:hypothetical protein